MTIGTTINIAEFSTDGSATEFSYFFPVFEKSHLTVLLLDPDGEVVVTYAQNEFSVSGLGTSSGTVVIDPPPADGHRLLVKRDVPYTQDTDIVNQGGFFPEVIEKQFDLIVMQIQSIREELNRAIVAALGDAGYELGVLSSGDLLQNVNGVLQGFSLTEILAPITEAIIIAQAVGGPLYADTSIGIASTVNGQGFAVDNMDGTANVYVNTSGIATFVRLIIIDPTADSAASFIGTASGDSVQDVLDALGGGSGINLGGSVTGVLGIANGGTGGNTAAAARTALGAAASGANADITSIRQSTTLAAGGTLTATSIGFRGLPLSGRSQGSAITFALDDSCKLTPNTSGGWVIPANSSVAVPIGFFFAGYNDSDSNQSLSINTDTLRRMGTTQTGTRQIAGRGGFTATKIKETEWVVEGNFAS